MKELKKSLDDSGKLQDGVSGSDASQLGSTNGREPGAGEVATNGLEDVLKGDFDVDAVKNWIDVSSGGNYVKFGTLTNQLPFYHCRRITSPSILTSLSTCRWRSLRHL